MWSTEKMSGTCFDHVSIFFSSVLKLSGSHNAAAEHIYRLQSHSGRQPQAHGLLLGRCSRISGQQWAAHIRSALPMILHCGWGSGWDVAGDHWERRTGKHSPHPRTQKRCLGSIQNILQMRQKLAKAQNPFSVNPPGCCYSDRLFLLLHSLYLLRCEVLWLACKRRINVSPEGGFG